LHIFHIWSGHAKNSYFTISWPASPEAYLARPSPGLPPGLPPRQHSPGHINHHPKDALSGGYPGASGDDVGKWLETAFFQTIKIASHPAGPDAF